MRRHHFLSLRPLLKPSLVSNEFSPSSKATENEELARKIQLFDQIYPEYAMPGVECGHPREMSRVIDFVNSSEEVHNRLHHVTKNAGRKTVHASLPRTRDNHPIPYRLDSILALSTFR